MTKPKKAKGSHAVLERALTHGRVTGITATLPSIKRLVRHGLLCEGDLGGTYVLTSDGYCAVGQPLF